MRVRHLSLPCGYLGEMFSNHGLPLQPVRATRSLLHDLEIRLDE